jgi:hypothetical protein
MKRANITDGLTSMAHDPDPIVLNRGYHHRLRPEGLGQVRVSLTHNFLDGHCFV